MAAAPAVYSPPIEIGPRYNYILEGWLKTERLKFDEAFFTVVFLDEKRTKPIETCTSMRHPDDERLDEGPPGPGFVHADAGPLCDHWFARRTGSRARCGTGAAPRHGPAWSGAVRRIFGWDACRRCCWRSTILTVCIRSARKFASCASFQDLANPIRESSCSLKTPWAISWPKSRSPWSKFRAAALRSKVPWASPGWLRHPGIRRFGRLVSIACARRCLVMAPTTACASNRSRFSRRISRRRTENSVGVCRGEKSRCNCLSWPNCWARWAFAGSRFPVWYAEEDALRADALSSIL